MYKRGATWLWDLFSKGMSAQNRGWTRTVQGPPNRRTTTYSPAPSVPQQVLSQVGSLRFGQLNNVPQQVMSQVGSSRFGQLNMGEQALIGAAGLGAVGYAASAAAGFGSWALNIAQLAAGV